MDIFKGVTPTPMLATTDIKRSEKFYSDVLGFKTERSDMGPMFKCKAGRADFIVYESEYAGTNKANTLVWELGKNFDDVMEALHKKGIKFEHYPDLGGMKLDGDVHKQGDDKRAWFKDVDGNLLHIVS